MTLTILNTIISLQRHTKVLLQISTDLIITIFSIFLAMGIRLERLEFLDSTGFWISILIVAPTTIFILYGFGLYRIMIRHMSLLTLGLISVCSFISAIFFFFVSLIPSLTIPRSVPLLYLMLLFFGIGGIRLLVSQVISWKSTENFNRVAIYGAGDAGRQLLNGLLKNEKYTPVLFIDDNPQLHGIFIGGVRVFDIQSAIAKLSDLDINMILIAIPSATKSDLQQIHTRLRNVPVQVKSLPGLANLIDGRVQFDQLRDLSIEDLLGRLPVASLNKIMSKSLKQKAVLVTGAGGSIGSELCYEIIKHNPEKLIIFDVSEFALYKINSDLEKLNLEQRKNITIIPILGTVQNEQHLIHILETFKIHTVYHAAAYKHVPLVESNIFESIINNAFGTLNIVQTAVKAGVKSFILVSTDKAVRPKNYMGASKRIAELICQAFTNTSVDTKFSIVRFGNVLGSSGSVIPLFEKQIKLGGPVTVTHPHMTRYFMTLGEAASLVIQAGSLADKGDVCVLDMGEAINILELAERMIRLHGFTPFFQGGDVPELNGIEIKIVGLRPGEKLFEELVIEGQLKKTLHPKIFTVCEPKISLAQLQPQLKQLQNACLNRDLKSIDKILNSLPIGFCKRLEEKGTPSSLKRKKGNSGS